MCNTIKRNTQKSNTLSGVAAALVRAICLVPVPEVQWYQRSLSHVLPAAKLVRLWFTSLHQCLKFCTRRFHTERAYASGQENPVCCHSSFSFVSTTVPQASARAAEGKGEHLSVFKPWLSESVSNSFFFFFLFLEVAFVVSRELWVNQNRNYPFKREHLLLVWNSKSNNTISRHELSSLNW